jgi:hypothetical protein
MGGWLKLYRRPQERAADNLELSLDLRLWLLIVSRVGVNGHTPFGDGELRRLLPKLTATTGEISSYSERHISRAVASLIACRLLAAESNARCCVVPLGVTDSNDKSARKCPEHGHLYAWQGLPGQGGGWVEVDPQTGYVVG